MRINDDDRERFRDSHDISKMDDVLLSISKDVEKQAPGQKVIAERKGRDMRNSLRALSLQLGDKSSSTFLRINNDSTMVIG